MNGQVSVKLPESITELQDGLLNGQYTCHDLISGYIDQIKRNNPKLNALVVPLFNQAISQAVHIDEKIKNGEKLGELFGVPVTIKECLDLVGTPTTWGLTSKLQDIAKTNDPLVTRLLQSDAVIMGKTNVQQLLLGSECVNPVYGRTVNPHDHQRSPGGSSGGEGAALAAGFSLVGIGTDAGGSVRIPAHFSGVHALKPTSETLPMNPPRDIYTVKGEVGRLISQPGILASHVSDLKKAFNILASRNTSNLNKPLTELKIGYFKKDGIIEPSAAIQRLVDEVIHLLRSQGFVVEEIDLPNLQEISRSYFQLVMNGALEGYAKTIGENEVIPKIKGITKLLSLPAPMRGLAVLTLKLMKQPLTANLIFKSLKEIPLNQLLEKQKQQKEVILSSLKDRDIDLIICPPYPTPALRHDQEMTIEGVYAQIFNYLGFPAGVVSLSRVRTGEVILRKETGDRVIQGANQTDLDSEGLPIGIQVASLPHQEEEILQMMSLLEETYQELV